MRSVIALCPQPAQSVVLFPRYSPISSPTRFNFFGGDGGADVVAMLFLLLGNNRIRNGAGVDGQPAIVKNAAKFCHVFWVDFHAKQTEHLRVAVLFNHINTLVAVDEILNLLVKGISTHATVAGINVMFLFQLIEAFDYRPVAGAVGKNTESGR